MVRLFQLARQKRIVSQPAMTGSTRPTVIFSPLDQTGPHIQALARISRLMLTEHFRTDLAKAESGEEILRIIAQYEG